MSAQRDEILAFLDAELETHRYRDYAPIGMQVIGAERVERVATAVSSTLEVFDRAAVEGAQMLLVHHGMFWDNEPRAIGAHMRRRLERLFAADITLAAYHLPLDGHQRIGNNARLAQELRLRVDGWFSQHGGIPLAVHGTLAAPLPLQTLAERVQRSPAAFRSRSPAGPSACARSRSAPAGPAGSRSRPRRSAPTRCSRASRRRTSARSRASSACPSCAQATTRPRRWASRRRASS